MRRAGLAESEVVRAIRKHRAETAANELETLKRLARLWVPSYRYLQKQVTDLLAVIKAQQDAGKEVWIGHIHSLERYRTMMAQAEQMIRQYNRAAAGEIRGTEAEMTELGRENGRQLVSIAEPDDPMWTRVNKREARITAGMTAEDTPLDRLLEKSFGQMKEGMESALITGISTGQGSSWIAEQLMKAAEIPEQRALLIARTEVNRAYRQSNWEQMQSSRAVRGYRRMCYPDTACFACLMLDGEFYPIDAEPCDHPNGKCSFVPVTKHFDPGNDPSWQRGRDWFMEQDEEDHRRIMGAGRFDLWKSGVVDPRDMVYIKPNQTWGGSPAVKTLESLRSFPGVSLHQEGSDPQIPKSIEGDFSDFDPLEIDNETRKIFKELHSLEQQDHNEHAQIISEIDKSDILSSEKFDKVEIDLGLCKGDHLRIYHSHTNLTPPSTPDLRKLCTPRVDEIGNIAINGDTFIVRIGDGIKPNLSEFDEAAKQIQDEVTKDLMKDPNFFDWSKEEKDYMYIREKFYRIAREFGWQMEGGNIDEQ